MEKTLRSKHLTRTYKYYNFTKKANVYKNQKKKHSGFIRFEEKKFLLKCFAKKCRRGKKKGCMIYKKKKIGI